MRSSQRAGPLANGGSATGGSATGGSSGSNGGSAMGAPAWAARPTAATRQAPEVAIRRLRRSHVRVESDLHSPLLRGNRAALHASARQRNVSRRHGSRFVLSRLVGSRLPGQTVYSPGPLLYERSRGVRLESRLLLPWQRVHLRSVRHHRRPNRALHVRVNATQGGSTRLICAHFIRTSRSRRRRKCRATRTASRNRTCTRRRHNRRRARIACDTGTDRPPVHRTRTRNPRDNRRT
jgi:hypothetical protein